MNAPSTAARVLRTADRVEKKRRTYNFYKPLPESFGLLTGLMNSDSGRSPCQQLKSDEEHIIYETAARVLRTADSVDHNSDSGRSPCQQLKSDEEHIIYETAA